MGKYVKYGLHAVIIIGLVIAGFKYLNGEDIWTALQSFNYLFLPFVLLLSTLYFVIKAWRFHLFLNPFLKTKREAVMRAYAAGQAATLVPGGITARIGLLKQAGVPVEASSVPVAFSSLADQTLFLASALVAAVFFEPARLPALIILGVLAVLAGLLLIPPLRHGLRHLADALAARFNAKDKLDNFFDNVTKLLSPKTLSWTLGLTLFSLIVEFITLDLVIRGLGAAVPYSSLALAYILPTMLGRLSGLPAGVGVTEAGMLGFLSSYGGLGNDVATAATLIFRLTTAFFRALLGALIYAFGWRGDKENAQKFA
ncbi:MAG: flippase-like domain-containing protein [Trueperaceae bacterium]|nr:flippase-like domain-containing protein [Trueperaceae bacterium]